jgi:hypothetical protein
MSSQALVAQGTALKIAALTSPYAYTEIPEIKTFNGPGGSATVIDVTDLSSVAREKRMGIMDEGQLTFTLHYIPTNTEHMALEAARESGEKASFQLTFTDSSPSTTWEFKGYVTTFAISGSVDGVIEGNVTIEITGLIQEV